MAKTTRNAKIGTEVKAAAPAPAAYTPPQTPAQTPTPAAKTTTQVRNTPLPKTPPTPQPRRDVTHETIARRAYEISISGSGGSDFDNWIRAERELKGGK